MDLAHHFTALPVLVESTFSPPAHTPLFSISPFLHWSTVTVVVVVVVPNPHFFPFPPFPSLPPTENKASTRRSGFSTCSSSQSLPSWLLGCSCIHSYYQVVYHCFFSYSLSIYLSLCLCPCLFLSLSHSLLLLLLYLYFVLCTLSPCSSYLLLTYTLGSSRHFRLLFTSRIRQ